MSKMYKKRIAKVSDLRIATGKVPKQDTVKLRNLKKIQNAKTNDNEDKNITLPILSNGKNK
jgi:hypothetical protein